MMSDDLPARVRAQVPQLSVPFIVVFALRYDRRSGIGTVIALMLPYFVALTTAWTGLFVIWYLLGLPWGL